MRNRNKNAVNVTELKKGSQASPGTSCFKALRPAKPAPSLIKARGVASTAILCKVLEIITGKDILLSCERIGRYKYFVNLKVFSVEKRYGCMVK